MVRVKGLEKEAVKVKRQTSATGKRIIRRERAREEKGGANTDQNLFNHLRRVRRVTNWCVFFKYIILQIPRNTRSLTSHLPDVNM